MNTFNVFPLGPQAPKVPGSEVNTHLESRCYAISNQDVMPFQCIMRSRLAVLNRAQGILGLYI